MIEPDLTGTGLPPNPYNPLAWLVGDPEVGDGCWIGAFTLIDGSGGLSIGNGCDISSGAQIYSHSTVRRVISERWKLRECSIRYPNRPKRPSSTPWSASSM